MLKEESDQWPEMQQEMSVALKEMRVDTDTNFTVKNPINSNSALAKKRRNKGDSNIKVATIAENMDAEWRFSIFPSFFVDF